MRFLDRLVYVQAFSRVATPRCRLLCSRICDRTTVFACVTRVDRCGLTPPCDDSACTCVTRDLSEALLLLYEMGPDATSIPNYEYKPYVRDQRTPNFAVLANHLAIGAFNMGVWRQSRDRRHSGR